MPRQDDRVVIVCQHNFNLFVESAAHDRHGLSSEIVQALATDIVARNSAVAWYVESEVLGTGSKIAVDVTATKRSVSLTDYCFQGVGHGMPVGLRCACNSANGLPHAQQLYLEHQLRVRRNQPRHLITVCQMRAHSQRTPTADPHSLNAP
jgi:hypothetical protein